MNEQPVTDQPEKSLDRLLDGASQAGEQEPAGFEKMPEPLQERVLSIWRTVVAEQAQARLRAASLVLMFRRALLCAALLMAASVLACLISIRPGEEDGMDIAASWSQGELSGEGLPDDSGAFDLMP